MRTFTSVSLLAAAVLAQNPSGSYGKKDPDTKLSFEEICAENGFEVEVHAVTTEDGYILNVFRIPGFVGDDEE
jgi:hypothetical protein